MIDDKYHQFWKSPFNQAAILVVIVFLIGSGTWISRKIANGHKTRHEVAATIRNIPALFTYERTSHLGERTTYSLDCPGTEICVVEISTNGVVIAKSDVKWNIVEAFFVHYSGSTLVRSPASHAASSAHILVQWHFKYGQNDAQGILTDQAEERSVAALWDALFLSLI